MTEKTTSPDELGAAYCSTSCCFSCKYWNGKRRTDTAYCHRLNLSAKDAPHGNAVCVLWEKRINSRMPKQIGRSSRG